MKRIKRIFITFIMLISAFSIINIFSYEAQAVSYKDMMTQAQDFIQRGEAQAGEMSDGINAVTAELLPLGQILTSIGAGVLVAVITFMGIKYITSGPEAQGKLKQQLIGVVVSGVVIFGAYGIWQLVGKIVSTF